MAGDLLAQTSIGNRTVTSIGFRNAGSDFVYFIRVVSTVDGTVDSLGGSFADNNDGADSTIIILYANDAGVPGAILDSTGFILVNNSSSSVQVEKVGNAVNSATVVSGTTYWIGVWARSAHLTSTFRLGRDGNNSGDNGTFPLDSTFLGADASPIANPWTGGAWNTPENAFTLFMVIQASAATSYPTTLMGGTYKQVTIK